MEIQTFDTFLTNLCDDFDTLIAPKKIARSNTNIIYLLFKAISKGMELINNICVVLSNKFNPAKCSEEDLVSVASLVGTQIRSGSASGLHVLVTNPTQDAVTLPAGVYTYDLDEDTTFEFEVITDTEIEAESQVSYIAMSDKIGSFPVTAQPSIDVKSEQTIPSDLVFSCTDNQNLLGRPQESILDFRKRVLNTYDRQNTIVELEEYLKNLPYVFDCKVKYNQTENDIADGAGLVIPPMTCAILVAGEIKNELAEMVCDYIICPTVSTPDSVEVRYNNSVFANGYHAVNIIPFGKLEYSVDIIYTVNGEYVNIEEAQNTIRKALMQALVAEVHVDYVKEEDIYNVINTIGSVGLNVLAVNLKVNGEAVDFIDVPVSQIAELTQVNFAEG